jgi:hypothetical protein
MLPTLGRQFRKYGRDARDEIGGRLRRDGTRRDLGFPGGRVRPALVDLAALERPWHGKEGS